VLSGEEMQFRLQIIISQYYSPSFHIFVNHILFLLLRNITSSESIFYDHERTVYRKADSPGGGLISRVVLSSLGPYYCVHMA
jgi:hypothetical protein